MNRIGRIVAGTALLCLCSSMASAAEPARPLYVGWAQADITPQKPVPLVGQMHKRISKSVHDPLTATVLALETRSGDGRKEQAIMVSCDLCVIKKATQDRVRESVKARLNDLDADKLFLNATHTHTAPPTDDGFDKTTDVSKDEGVMNAAEYADFFVERVTGAVVRAWQGRNPGGMSWALGHAVVGHNRRAVYADGKAAMYGSIAKPDFVNFEGYTDHALELLFFWGAKIEPAEVPPSVGSSPLPEVKLTGMVINLACTSQETENESYVSADFWHEVREEIKKRYSNDTFVLAQCATAGDQSPHPLLRKRAEEIMAKRNGNSRRQELALRIVRGVEDVFPAAKADIQTSLVFKHAVARIEIPQKEPPDAPFYKADRPAPAELHFLRLGDVALATNPFELFLDYGVRMKAQSKGVLTMLVQLSCAHCGYLPTAKAVGGGGYSADKYLVGPEGGDVLVGETVKQINRLWE